MDFNEDYLLSDYELDDVVGGKTYTYQLMHHPTKGDYYKCVSPGRTICIGANKWDEWIKKCNERGDKLISATK
ncbi:MAG: hypothetical protein II567_13630 [Candidatus Riflebacteria bacterium]|jgi:hypothetical protein|nr:hypothetical protein [Candidatus Riflebacteria bacterium]